MQICIHPLLYLYFFTMAILTSWETTAGAAAALIVHELGHFLTAKAFGVKVQEFAIGMGPALLHYEGPETTYSLRLIPMGGFVQMEGEEEESEDPLDSEWSPEYIPHEPGVVRPVGSELKF